MGAAADDALVLPTYGFGSGTAHIIQHALNPARHE